MIAFGVASACVSFAGQALAADFVVNKENESTNSETQQCTDKDIIGSADDNFKATGTWSELLLSKDGTKHTISGFGKVDIALTNISESGDVNSIKATNNGSLEMDVGALNVSMTGTSSSGSVVGVHAFGGNLKINASQSITIKNDIGNGIFVQSVGSGKTANATFETNGDFSVTSRGFAVGAGLLNEGMISSTVKITANNITLTSTVGDGLCVYDQDVTFNPYDPRSGDAHAELLASGKVTIEGARFGVYQTRQGALPKNGSNSTIQAADGIEIHGKVGAANAVSANSENGSGTVTFDAPEISLKSDGATYTWTDKNGNHSANYATLRAGNNGVVNFKSSLTDTTHVNITAATGDAVKIEDGGTVAAKNAEINVTKGNVISGENGTGVLSLKNSSLELASGVKASLGVVDGTNATIVFNDLAEGTVSAKTNKTNLKVLASSDLTAKLGAEAVAKDFGKAVSVTDDQGSTVYGGQGTGLTSDYTVDPTKGTVTYDNGGNAESAVLSSVKHFNAATLSQWRYEVNHLSERLGDLRNQTGAIGTWARVYGMNAKVSDSVQTKLRANSIQVGADVKVGDNWIVGAAFGYTDSDSDFNNGSATADGYTLSAYGTAFFPCGGYVDLIARVGRISTDVGLNASSAKYDNTTFGLSAEVGYKWDVNDVFYVTPQAELSYGFAAGDDYAMTHEQGTVYVEQDNFTSLLGRVGVQFGANFPENAGQIYLTASVNHDFKGETKANTYQGVERRHIEEDLGGTWVSYGVGAQFNVNDSWSFYGSLTRANGSDYQENYRYSVGTVLRW